MLLMTLGACGTPTIKFVEKTVYVSPEVPDRLLQCRSLPDVPVDGTRQRAVAEYIVDLHETATDCKKKLNGVDLVLAQHQDRLDGMNQPKR